MLLIFVYYFNNNNKMFFSTGHTIDRPPMVQRAGLDRRVGDHTQWINIAAPSWTQPSGFESSTGENHGILLTCTNIVDQFVWFNAFISGTTGSHSKIHSVLDIPLIRKGCKLHNITPSSKGAEQHWKILRKTRK